VSELPTGWTAATGLDLFEQVRGVSYDKSAIQAAPATGFVPILRANNISGGRLNRDELVHAPERFVADKQRLRFADFIIASSSGSKSVVGKAAMVSDEFVGSSFGAFCTVARPRSPELAHWLRHYFSTRAYRDYVEEVALGININNLRGKDLEAVSIPLPPLPQQQRIVEKLDALTARTARARADLDRIPALAARYKQSVLAKAFSGELTANWPSSETTAKATWNSTTVGALAWDVRYGTAAKCTYSPSDTPVLRIPNIAQGLIDTTELKHAVFSAKDIEKLSLETGDLLVIRSNGSLGLVGRTAVVTSEVAGFLFAGYLIRIRLDLTKANPEFLHLAFQEPNTRVLIESFAKSTSGVNNINSEQLKGLSVPLPPLEEQDEIVRQVRKAFHQIDRMVTEATTSRRLLDRLEPAILAKAFRGDLLPQDPSDEPASVLLDRIRAERANAPKASRGRRKASAA